MTNKFVGDSIELMDEWVQSKINKLDEEERENFNSMFSKHVRSRFLADVFAFFSLHYLYVDIKSVKNWILQALYLATSAGFGVWLIVDLFRMKSILGKTYTEKAEKILQKIRM